METTSFFRGRTILITGASRGIGRAMALHFGRLGAHIVIAAKSIREDERLGGTIYTVAEEVERLGGRALPVACDIREEDQVAKAVDAAVLEFGGIDAVINNASAISLTDTATTELKRFDLMHDINVRGTFLVTKQCLPHLKAASNPHILTLSPPLDLNPAWLGPHAAYTVSKYSMSLLTLGWAEEFKAAGIAANALWPVTTIATAAVKNLLGGDALIARSRTPEILADAAAYILEQPSGTYTGKLLLDEDVLRDAGVASFDSYAVTPGGPLQRDLFVS